MSLTAIVLRFAARAGTRRADTALLALLALGTPLGACSSPHTGMETSLCLAVLAFALSSLVSGEAARSVPAAFMTVLAYLCRPDAALIPALVFVIAERRRLRSVLSYCAVLGVLLGLLLCAFRLYYGSALPLPFYAKTAGLSRYDSELRALGLHGKMQHLLTFCAFGAPLAWVAARGRDARVSALLVASAAFVAYQALVTDEIMGYRARFYLPALVPLVLAAILAWDGCAARSDVRAARSAWLVWAACIGVAYVAGLVESSGDPALDRVPGTAYACAIIFGGAPVRPSRRKSGAERTGRELGEQRRIGTKRAPAAAFRTRSAWRSTTPRSCAARARK